jgi:hypothetical protein
MQGLEVLDRHCMLRSTQGIGHGQPFLRSESRHAPIVTQCMLYTSLFYQVLHVRAVEALALHVLLTPVA